MPWADDPVCGVCGGSLLTLSYSPASLDDHSLSIEARADAKCASCGWRYRWDDLAGWTPIDFESQRLVDGETSQLITDSREAAEPWAGTWVVVARAMPLRARRKPQP